MVAGAQDAPARVGAGREVRDIALMVLFLLQGAGARGGDFVLQWTALTPQQAVLTPGNPPSTATSASPQSPARRETKSASGYPLYGRLQVTKEGPLLFRLDESKGSGSGYDRLIFDFNRNGDLTDDLEYEGTVSRPGETPYIESTLFGPVMNPTEWKVGPWQAPLIFKMSLRHRSWWGRPLRAPESVGQLQAKPGWYLQTTLIGGDRQESVGLLDCNCNFKLGETPSVVGPRNQIISFTMRDLLLRDHDRNGSFDFNALFTDTQYFPNIISLGTNVFTVELDPNLRFIRLQPYLGPVGEVKLYDKLQSASLAWRRDQTWTLISVGLEHSRATVPAGTYCFHSCVLRGVDANGQPILARGINNSTTNSFQVAEGQTTRVRCGGPVELRVAATFRPASGSRPGSQELGQLGINVRVSGAGGETYASFARGPDLSVRSPPATFRLINEAGQTILNGQLEYG